MEKKLQENEERVDTKEKKAEEQTTENEMNDQKTMEEQKTQNQDTDGHEQAEEQLPEEMKQLKDELDQVKQEKEELYERLLRLQADYENYRRRTKKERENDLKYKAQDLITELLPVLDNFERALQVEVNDDQAKSFVDGIKMVHRQFKDALTKQGLEEIQTVGEQFDPHLHQAVMQVQDDEKESNEVVEELQKGYKLKDRIIRPAMVKVNQ